MSKVEVTDQLLGRLRRRAEEAKRGHSYCLGQCVATPYEILALVDRITELELKEKLDVHCEQDPTRCSESEKALGYRE